MKKCHVSTYLFCGLANDIAIRVKFVIKIVNGCGFDLLVLDKIWVHVGVYNIIAMMVIGKYLINSIKAKYKGPERACVAHQCAFGEKDAQVTTIQWRHNGRDVFSNHQPGDCLLNRLFRRRSKKTSKLRGTDLWAGNSPVPGEFPAQMASNAENDCSVCAVIHDHGVCVLFVYFLLITATILTDGNRICHWEVYSIVSRGKPSRFKTKSTLH